MAIVSHNGLSSKGVFGEWLLTFWKMLFTQFPQSTVEQSRVGSELLTFGYVKTFLTTIPPILWYAWCTAACESSKGKSVFPLCPLAIRLTSIVIALKCITVTQESGSLNLSGRVVHSNPQAFTGSPQLCIKNQDVHTLETFLLSCGFIGSYPQPFSRPCCPSAECAPIAALGQRSAHIL